MFRQGLARPVRRFTVETCDPIALSRFNMLAFNDLAATAAVSTRWVWDGYLAAGRAVVVSEESLNMWAHRGTKLNFGDHIQFACRPFRARPTPTEWRAMVDDLAAVHARSGLDLAVIDPLAPFLPGPDENNAVS